MRCILEHANMTVKNLDEAIRFLTAAFPHFAVRGSGTKDGIRWVHFGTQDTYLALNDGAGAGVRGAYENAGVNHLGFVVDDAEAVKQRLLKAGYREGFVPPPHPHRRRVYFNDADNFEWEFVQYFSEDPKLKNDYTL